MQRMNFISVLLICLSLSQCTKSNEQILQNGKGKLILYVGTYTSGSSNFKSEGIYIFEVNLDSLIFKQLQVTPASNPSYLSIHPNKKFLYCVNEDNTGKVSAFSIDSIDGHLTFLNSVSSKGSAPCYIGIENKGKFAFVANYNSGNYVLYKINIDGHISESIFVIQDKGSSINPYRQDKPHAHMIEQNPQNGFIYATNLGTDQVHTFTLDITDSSLKEHISAYTTEKGAGPRHLAFHPYSKWMYILTELKGTIEVVSLNNENGKPEKIQTISTLPAGETQYPGSADIHITPDGNFLYATNRGEINNIAIYRIDKQSGLLTLIGHEPSGGKTPRNFIIDPSGKYLLVANQDSDNIVIFSILPDGKLISLPIQLNVPKPVCLKFLQL